MERTEFNRRQCDIEKQNPSWDTAREVIGKGKSVMSAQFLLDTGTQEQVKFYC